MKKFLTIDEVKELLNISYPTVKKFLDNGDIKCFKIGKKYFIDDEKLLSMWNA